MEGKKTTRRSKLGCACVSQVASRSPVAVAEGAGSTPIPGLGLPRPKLPKIATHTAALRCQEQHMCTLSQTDKPAFQKIFLKKSSIQRKQSSVSCDRLLQTVVTASCQSKRLLGFKFRNKFKLPSTLKPNTHFKLHSLPLIIRGSSY